jgi:hypothetical protein
MKALVPFFLCLFLVSCSAVRVSYDYDRDVDFTNYTTYNVYEDLNTGLSSLDEKRLLRALDMTMKAKGLLYSEEADLLIDIKSGVFRSQPGNNIGVGLGGTGRNIGGGISVGIPVGGPKLERELQFILVDAKRDQLIWEATSNSAYNETDSPAIKNQKIQELVTKVFEKFPPQAKKNN